MTTLIGQEFGGYRIISQVGKGGMATVYKAFQSSLDRYVAVKVMPPFYAQEDDTFLKRFKREARSVAKLRHPNILMVIDFGEHDGLTYIVMEYVEAGTLTDRLGSPMPLNDIATIIDQVAGALDHGHGQGVIHRDVKPSNILLPKPNWPLLTDFGLAKIVGGSQLTITGTIAGTPAYMSPEQGQGEPVDSRSDIYSLGIVLYEMATGRVPYHAETPMAVVVKHIIEALPLPRSINPSLPEEIERVILKALAKRPADRYQRVKDMSNALIEACEHVGAPKILKETVIEDVAKETPHPGAGEVSIVEKEVSQIPTVPAPEEPPFAPIPSAPSAESPVMVPTSTPPPPIAAVPTPSATSRFLKDNRWMKWAIPAGLVVGFLCMIGLAALIIPPILNDTKPTATVEIDTMTVSEHIDLGYEFYDAGDYDEAKNEFEAAIGLGSEDLDMYYILADAYYALNMLDEALGTVEKAVSIAPNDAWVQESAGWFYQSIDLHEEAIGQFERALDLDPGAEWVFEGLAISYEALGDFDRADEIWGMIGSGELGEDPYVLEEQGWEYFLNNDFVAAQQAFSRAIDLDPSLLSAWSGLSDTYWYQGDNQSAVEILQAALEGNPPEAWVYEQIGLLYSELAEYDASIEAYELAIDLDPDWTQAYGEISDLYYEIGEYDSALGVLEQGLAANPERSDILEYLGWLYIDFGEYENAISVFQGSTEIDPYYTWNYYGLALAYEYSGRFDEAGVALETASANSFDDPWLESSIGWEYIELGRCDLAIIHFEIALQIDSSLQDAQDGIETCGG